MSSSWPCMYVRRREGSLHAGPCFPHYYFHSRTFFSFSNKWLVQRWASQAMSKSKAFKVIQSQSNDYCFIIIWTNHIQESSFLYICQSTLHVLVVILWESAGSTVLWLWRDKYQLSLQRPWWPSPHDFPFQQNEKSQLVGHRFCTISWFALCCFAWRPFTKASTKQC